MIEFQIPGHTSHSAISSYIRCGKAFELKKLGVEETPSWWLLGGSAVHTATEWLDKGEWDEAPEFAFFLAFQQEIDKTLEKHPNQDEWHKAGYGARAQGYEHWMQQGPRYVKQWESRDFRWVHVEVDVSTELPSGILIKGYIDRIARKGVDGFAIYDLKTGSTRPDSDQQLGVYKVLFEHKYETEVSGAYNYMFKDDEFYEMDVSNWTLETVDQMAKEWYNGLESGVFLPNRGKQCGTCGVARACYLAAGDTVDTRSYDRLNPRHGE